MKSTLFLILITYVLGECYYTSRDTEHYCSECCYWYDGEWYCETYSYCYTVIAITLSVWIIVCVLYLVLYFYSKKKTDERQKRIHDLAAKAQREGVVPDKKLEKPIEQELTLEQKYDQPSITMKGVEILNDQL